MHKTRRPKRSDKKPATEDRASETTSTPGLKRSRHRTPSRRSEDLRDSQRGDSATSGSASIADEEPSRYTADFESTADHSQSTESASLGPAPRVEENEASSIWGKMPSPTTEPLTDSGAGGFNNQQSATMPRPHDAVASFSAGMPAQVAGQSQPRYNTTFLPITSDSPTQNPETHEGSQPLTGKHVDSSPSKAMATIGRRVLPLATAYDSDFAPIDSAPSDEANFGQPEFELERPYSPAYQDSASSNSPGEQAAEVTTHAPCENTTAQQQPPRRSTEHGDFVEPPNVDATEQLSGYSGEPESSDRQPSGYVPEPQRYMEGPSGYVGAEAGHVDTQSGYVQEPSGHFKEPDYVIQNFTVDTQPEFLTPAEEKSRDVKSVEKEKIPKPKAPKIKAKMADVSAKRKPTSRKESNSPIIDGNSPALLPSHPPSWEPSSLSSYTTEKVPDSAFYEPPGDTHASGPRYGPPNIAQTGYVQINSEKPKKLDRNKKAQDKGKHVPRYNVSRAERADHDHAPHEPLLRETETHEALDGRSAPTQDVENIDVKTDEDTAIRAIDGRSMFAHGGTEISAERAPSLAPSWSRTAKGSGVEHSVLGSVQDPAAPGPSIRSVQEDDSDATKLGTRGHTNRESTPAPPVETERRGAQIDPLLKALQGQPELAPEVAQAIITRLEDEDSYVRRAAVEALQGQPELAPEVAQAIAARLEDEDGYVRRAAVKALQGQPELAPEVAQAIITRLEDEDSYVRRAAIEALQGQPELAPELVQAIAVRLKELKSPRLENNALGLSRRKSLSPVADLKRPINPGRSSSERSGEEGDPDLSQSQALQQEDKTGTISTRASIGPTRTENKQELRERERHAAGLETASAGATEKLRTPMEYKRFPGSSHERRKADRKAVGSKQKRPERSNQDEDVRSLPGRSTDSRAERLTRADAEELEGAILLARQRETPQGTSTNEPNNAKFERLEQDLKVALSKNQALETERLEQDVKAELFKNQTLEIKRLEQDLKTVLFKNQELEKLFKDTSQMMAELQNTSQQERADTALLSSQFETTTLDNKRLKQRLAGLKEQVDQAEKAATRKLEQAKANHEAALRQATHQWQKELDASKAENRQLLSRSTVLERQVAQQSQNDHTARESEHTLKLQLNAAKVEIDEQTRLHREDTEGWNAKEIEFKAALALLEGNSAQLHGQIAQLTDEVETERQKHRSVKDALEAEEHKRMELSASLEHRIQQLESTHAKRLSVVEGAKANLEATLQSIKGEKERLGREKETLKGENEGLEAVIRRIKREKESLEGDKGHLGAEKKSLRGEMEKLEEENASLEAAIQRIKKEKEDLEGEKMNSTKEKESSKRETKRLGEENETLQGAIERIKTEKESLKGRNQILEGEKEKITQEKEKIEGDNDRLRGEKGSLERRLQILERENERITREKKKMQEENYRLEGEKERITREDEKIQRENDRLEGEKGRLERQLQEVTDQHRSALILLDEERARAKLNNKQVVDDLVRRSQAELEAQEKKLSNSAAAKEEALQEDARRRVSVLASQLERLNENLEEKRKQVEEYRMAVSNQEVAIGIHQSEKDELNTKTIHLQEANANLKERLKKLEVSQQELMASRAVSDTLQSQLARKDADLRTEQDKAAALRAELKGQDAAVRAAQEEAARAMRVRRQQQGRRAYDQDMRSAFEVELGAVPKQWTRRHALRRADDTLLRAVAADAALAGLFLRMAGPKLTSVALCSRYDPDILAHALLARHLMDCVISKPFMALEGMPPALVQELQARYDELQKVNRKRASLFFHHILEAFSQETAASGGDSPLPCLGPGEPTQSHEQLAQTFINGPAGVFLRKSNPEATNPEATTELARIVRKAVSIAALVCAQPVEVRIRDYAELAGSRFAESAGANGPGQNDEVETHGSQDGQPVRSDAVVDLVVQPAVTAVDADGTKVWGRALVLWG